MAFLARQRYWPGLALAVLMLVGLALPWTHGTSFFGLRDDDLYDARFKMGLYGDIDVYDAIRLALLRWGWIVLIASPVLVAIADRRRWAAASAGALALVTLIWFADGYYTWHLTLQPALGPYLVIAAGAVTVAWAYALYRAGPDPDPLGGGVGTITRRDRDSGQGLT